jgi:hypothetical protein
MSRYCMRSSPRAAALAALFVAFPLPAFAYIDPGSGSMILQSLLAAIAMVAGAAAVFFQQIKAFFSRRQPKSDDAEARDDEPLR